MAYEAGSAFIQIIPSFAGVVNSIRDESAKWGEEAGLDFERSSGIRQLDFGR